MKKAFLFLTLIAFATMAFKSSPKFTRAPDYSTKNNSIGVNNYITPLKKNAQLQRWKLYPGTYNLSPEGTIVAQSNLGQFTLNFQPDGNLVLYSVFPIYRALWASGPTANDVTHMVVSNHGWIAIYRGQSLLWSDGSPWLCSNNNASNYFVLQDDGNFVKYNYHCNSSVSTRTHGGQHSLNWGTFL